jgi:hypothetical protein
MCNNHASPFREVLKTWEISFNSDGQLVTYASKIVSKIAVLPLPLNELSDALEKLWDLRVVLRVARAPSSMARLLCMRTQAMVTREES